MEHILYILDYPLASCEGCNVELCVGETVILILKSKNPAWPTHVSATVLDVKYTENQFAYIFDVVSFDLGLASGVIEGCDIEDVVCEL